MKTIVGLFKILLIDPTHPLARVGLYCLLINAPRRTRTFNPLIKSQLLCRLS